MIKKPSSNSKSSDRRLAGLKAASSFLHSNTINSSNTKIVSSSTAVKPGKTVRKQVGDRSWDDDSLAEWDPKHFRLFVGNLGPDANDQLLIDAFSKFETLKKVKVPLDKKTGKNKGYGFVAFESSDSYLRAFKEMNGKYIGLYPVQLKRAETKIKTTNKSSKRRY